MNTTGTALANNGDDEKTTTRVPLDEV